MTDKELCANKSYKNLQKLCIQHKSNHTTSCASKKDILLELSKQLCTHRKIESTNMSEGIEELSNSEIVARIDKMTARLQELKQCVLSNQDNLSICIQNNNEEKINKLKTKYDWLQEVIQIGIKSFIEFTKATVEEVEDA